ncbi:MAG: hypothetical protein U5N85_04830 [Arcicella sp.]|nr:hypothetical protein [Arcicella sp.]
MKTALIFLCLTLPSLSYSQMVNNVPLKDIDAEYVEFYAIRTSIGASKHHLYLNYGQAFSQRMFVVRPEELRLKNEDGSEMFFNSEIDCLNFMAKNGFELISKSERVSGESSFPVFLMRRVRIEKSK